MFLTSLFKGEKYFDKSIKPKCDYCRFGKRAKDGNKVLCEKKGLVGCDDSCKMFSYSPLKRIPVKQLNFVGSLADEDIFIESASERAEREKEAAEIDEKIKHNSDQPADDKKADAKKPEEKKAEAPEKKAEAPEKKEQAPEEKEQTKDEKPQSEDKPKD